jgi:aspartyl-tRNA(Asn)/glutamyl-tRNA(Gln) amidotransferase subunit A
MKTMPLIDYSLAQLQSLLRSGEISATELCAVYLARITSIDGNINAYITVAAETARAAALTADRELAAGNARPLTGIPLALKDIFVTKGVRTTCASKILGDYLPPYDGTAVLRLKESGAVLLGKLNMDEFAMGSSNENSAFGPVRNPWNRDYVTGGSSGGSAACVAARTAVAALGTDTGGSIRQPASHCGVVGLKPTYGRVSRYGVIAYASSLDQVGPLTRDVRDCAILTQAIAGYDPLDSTSVDLPVPDYLAGLEGGVKGLRIGLPREYFGAGLDPEVKAALEAAQRVLTGLGAEFVEISLPHTEYAVACYYLIATAEASSNLARYDGIRFGLRVDDGEGLNALYCRSRAAGFGDEVKRRIMLGTYTLSAGYYDAYYLKALKVRRLIRGDYDKAFEEVDFIVGPTTPSPAFKLGEKTDDPLSMYLEDLYTVTMNLAGIGGMSIPCGFTKAGLPIGLQLQSRPFDEERLLRAAAMFQQATDWHTKRPALE